MQQIWNIEINVFLSLTLISIENQKEGSRHKNFSDRVAKSSFKLFVSTTIVGSVGSIININEKYNHRWKLKINKYKWIGSRVINAKEFNPRRELIYQSFTQQALSRVLLSRFTQVARHRIKILLHSTENVKHEWKTPLTVICTLKIIKYSVGGRRWKIACQN